MHEKIDTRQREKIAPQKHIIFVHDEIHYGSLACWCMLPFYWLTYSVFTQFVRRQFKIVTLVLGVMKVILQIQFQARGCGECTSGLNLLRFTSSLCWTLIPLNVAAATQVMLASYRRNYCIQHSVLSQHIEQPRYIGYGKQGEHRAPTNGSTGQQEERFTETSSFTLEPMILYANSSVQEWTLLARRLAQGSAPVLAHNPMQQHCQCSFQSLQYDKQLPRHHPLIPPSCILHCMAWCVKGLG